MLLVCIQTEETFRGHLLMCFMPTAAIKMMPDVLTKRKISLTVESMLGVLQEQHAIEYEERLVTTETVSKMNEAYRAFGFMRQYTVDLSVAG